MDTAPTQPAMVDENEFLAEMRDVEAGTVSVKLLSDPSELEGGRPEFKTANGWRFRVVTEMGVWHHIDAVWSPEGTHLDPWEQRWQSEYKGIRYYDAPRKNTYQLFKLKPSQSIGIEELEGNPPS